MDTKLQKIFIRKIGDFIHDLSFQSNLALCCRTNCCTVRYLIAIKSFLFFFQSIKNISISTKYRQRTAKSIRSWLSSTVPTASSIRVNTYLERKHLTLKEQIAFLQSLFVSTDPSQVHPSCLVHSIRANAL